MVSKLYISILMSVNGSAFQSCSAAGVYMYNV